MPCQPLNSGQFILPPSNTPGFAPQLPHIPIPNLPLPIQDLLALFNALNFSLPVGNLKPHFNNDFMKTLMSGIWHLLSQFAPFLMLYKFILPILNLILCIIEVLCSLNDPFKTAAAIIRLFRVCIPEFLALFPFFALILMIISLLLLIIALIEYLINRVLQLIELIIRNIEILAQATNRLDNDSITAILIKIGDLLCLLQNLFVIFGVIAIIIQVIKSMIALSFSIPPCDSSSGSGCCTPDVCPAFIKNNAVNGITSSTGNFLYLNSVGIDSGLTLPVGFPPIFSITRNESWQFYDPNLVQDQQFINIINAFDLPSGTSKIFFPNATTYTDTSSAASAPYTVDFRLFYIPLQYPLSPFVGGLPRFIKIVGAIVASPPTNGVVEWDGSISAPFDGTLHLVGGTIQEDDGTPILLNNKPVLISQFFHNATTPSAVDVNNPILYSNLTYTFKINTLILYSQSLITAGCLPDVSANKDFINSTIGAQFNANGANLSQISSLLPDLDAAQQCVFSAVNTLRNQISLDSVAQFQTNITTCLTDLNNQTITALTAVVSTGADQYTSSFSISPTIQFINLPITISVSLNESSGNSITTGLPAATAKTIASQMSAIASFGSATTFAYDGQQFFTATINSPKPGNGSVKVLFNGNFISVLSNPTDITLTPSVSILTLDYTFVESGASVAEPRRDDGDTSRSEI